MGLDFLATIKMRQSDREDYIRKFHADELMAGSSLADLVDKHAPITEKPCRIVGAPQMKELPDFRVRMQDYLNSRRDQAQNEMKVTEQFRNQKLIDHWMNRTLEQQMAEDGDKYCCDQCPLLKALQGADSQDSCFVGITVASCDFRGKRIGSDGALGDLADEAYNDHDPMEMFDYADRLEKKLDDLREAGLLEKDCYEDYVQKYQQDTFAKAMGEPLLTEDQYEQTLHWREQNVTDAVHWLQVCAGYHINMVADY